MSLFVMTRQRYEILCHLMNGSATIKELQKAVNVRHDQAIHEQGVALRNAGLIEWRGFRHNHGAPGPRPGLYALTGLGEAAIRYARVAVAVQSRAYINLADLQVPA